MNIRDTIRMDRPENNPENSEAFFPVIQPDLRYIHASQARTLPVRPILCHWRVPVRTYVQGRVDHGHEFSLYQEYGNAEPYGDLIRTREAGERSSLSISQ